MLGLAEPSPKKLCPLMSACNSKTVVVPAEDFITVCESFPSSSRGSSEFQLQQRASGAASENWHLCTPQRLSPSISAVNTGLEDDLNIHICLQQLSPQQLGHIEAAAVACGGAPASPQSRVSMWVNKAVSGRRDLHIGGARCSACGEAGRQRSIEIEASACPSPACPAAEPGPEIRMVWPVCLPLGDSRFERSCLDVCCPSTSPQRRQGKPLPRLRPLNAARTAGWAQSSILDGMQGEEDEEEEQAGHPTAVLRVTVDGTDLSVSAPVLNGTARCRLPETGLIQDGGLPWSPRASWSTAAPPSRGVPPPARMRMLTMFAASGGPEGSSGAAASVLCAPPAVAAELQGLFTQVAWKLLALERDPDLPHLQIMDVHGFMLLNGNGSVAASQPRDTVFSAPPRTPPPSKSTSQIGDSSTHAPPLNVEERELPQGGRLRPLVSAQLRPGGGGGRPLHHRANSVDLSSCSRAARLHLDGPPWLSLDSGEDRACAAAWADHYQPLMCELSYLLTCVPDAVPSGSWDHRTYCKALAGLVAYFEHHCCWATLAELLQHASAFGVVMLHCGVRVFSGEVLVTADGVEQLLKGARHDDIGVQYLTPTAAVAAAMGPSPLQDADVGSAGTSPGQHGGQARSPDTLLSSWLLDEDFEAGDRQEHCLQYACGTLLRSESGSPEDGVLAASLAASGRIVSGDLMVSGEVQLAAERLPCIAADLQAAMAWSPVPWARGVKAGSGNPPARCASGSVAASALRGPSPLGAAPDCRCSDPRRAPKRASSDQLPLRPLAPALSGPVAAPGGSRLRARGRCISSCSLCCQSGQLSRIGSINTRAAAAPVPVPGCSEPVVPSAYRWGSLASWDAAEVMLLAFIVCIIGSVVSACHLS